MPRYTFLIDTCSRIALLAGSAAAALWAVQQFWSHLFKWMQASGRGGDWNLLGLKPGITGWELQAWPSTKRRWKGRRVCFLFSSVDFQAFCKDKLLMVWCHGWGKSPRELIVAQPLPGGKRGFHNGKDRIILRKVCVFSSYSSTSVLLKLKY